MGRSKKSLRDVTRLSGKPLSETLIPSSVFGSTDLRASASNPTEGSNPGIPAQDPGLNGGGQGSESEQGWLTSSDLTEFGLPYTPEDIRETVLFHLQNPGLTSSVLFRADVLFDCDSNSDIGLGTRSQSEDCGGNGHEEDSPVPVPARSIPGFELRRTIVRRLVPRNPQLDQPVEQTCHLYVSGTGKGFLITYTPHVSSREELPYYHPQLRALGLLYESETDDDASHLERSERGSESGSGAGSGTLSVHFLPYPPSTSSSGAEPSITPRLERSLSNLLETQIRLTKNRLTNPGMITSSPYTSIKDNVVPRNRVQDAYSRLKFKYAADLCERWVEDTEPSKHVYEDLSIAAFLIEVWRDLYGLKPEDEESGKVQQQGQGQQQGNKLGFGGKQFPGFVDIACGNGVLVYILLCEGYTGWGFDARRRKTWSIFPENAQGRLKEEVYIPRPFRDALRTPSESESGSDSNSGLESTLHKNTFIISNHADELTLWTPLLAILLNPAKPPPFLAIPCCSHSLSGARYRYPPETNSSTKSKNKDNPESQGQNKNQHDNDSNSGDLKALRLARLASQDPQSTAFSTSTYGALKDKLVSVSSEVGIGTVKTLLRIPSTRNIGVIGGIDILPAGRKLGVRLSESEPESQGEESNEEEVLARLNQVVERECLRDGGVYTAARSWVERARGLMAGGGSASGHGHV